MDNTVLVSTAMALAATGAIAQTDQRVQVSSEFSTDDSILTEIDVILQKKISKDAVNNSFSTLVRTLSESDVSLMSRYFAEYEKSQGGFDVAVADSTLTSDVCVTKSCYSNCYGQCHSACHGSRGWR